MTETSATTEASDAELISQVRAGDIDAYGMLYDRHRDAAQRLARQLTTSVEADDLVPSRSPRSCRSSRAAVDRTSRSGPTS
ncbi:MAG: hypothetical protein ACRDQD_05705 [Nocardioidaceae bacterium]